MEREYIEWTNGWHEYADDLKKRRWLLIGDSVARDMRGRLQELVKPKEIAVDFFASSLHIEDPAFFKELQHFFSFEEYRYEIIFINWGAHHGLSRSCFGDEKIYFSYKTCYENFLNYILNNIQLPRSSSFSLTSLFSRLVQGGIHKNLCEMEK